MLSTLFRVCQIYVCCSELSLAISYEKVYQTGILHSEKYKSISLPGKSEILHRFQTENKVAQTPITQLQKKRVNFATNVPILSVKFSAILDFSPQTQS